MRHAYALQLAVHHAIQSNIRQRADIVIEHAAQDQMAGIVIGTVEQVIIVIEAVAAELFLPRGKIAEVIRDIRAECKPVAHILRYGGRHGNAPKGA